MKTLTEEQGLELQPIALETAVLDYRHESRVVRSIWEDLGVEVRKRCPDLNGSCDILEIHMRRLKGLDKSTVYTEQTKKH